MGTTGIALVTGGAKRIGRAISEDLAAHGFTVIVHANSSGEEAKRLVDDILSRGGRAHALTADLTDPAAVAALIPRASDLGGPIDLLVNNASTFIDDSLGNLDAETWDRHFSIHLKAPVFLAEAMAARLPRDREGLIINVIDQRVWRLTPNFVSYTLSKSALWTATCTLAQALAPHIRVNGIGPGPTLRNARQSEEDFQRQIRAVPLERGPELSEFGATIRYLWENRSITGQMIALDGGQHLAWETPDVAGVNE
ncbi:SDR family oxidoreductase [Oricola cellulosilytica]|uniref:SDR family oxidoreductase n=1 Tax=Oricola cellulosilytica TaxID=1429082 RepID=A0A4R0PCR3_9HYPH|nr:SDR family oxidoreductase [Oricola cellulosilytica]TCD14323.1 SDR family oxidoreductase [Oricola cellulosilytica]